MSAPFSRALRTTLSPKRRVHAVGPAAAHNGSIGGKVVSISTGHYQEYGAADTFEGHISFIMATMEF